jgi:hemerythrin-like domain-containing protein
MEPFADRFVPVTHAENVGFLDMAEKRTKSKVDQQIDENLKRVYDDVLKEAVPDRFMDLIKQLQTAEAARKTNAKDSDDA